MKLITKAIEKKLTDNWLANQEHIEKTGGHTLDHKPVVKFFNPYGRGTWLITEMNPEDNDTMFGLCDLGMGEPELGYVSLSELKSIKGPLPTLGIERDMYTTFDKPISEYTSEARTKQAITV